MSRAMLGRPTSWKKELIAACTLQQFGQVLYCSKNLQSPFDWKQKLNPKATCVHCGKGAFNIPLPTALTTASSQPQLIFHPAASSKPAAEEDFNVSLHTKIKT